MLSRDNHSISHAKSALILGHTHTGMGEKTLTFKFERALKRAGCLVHPVIDIVRLLGGDYERLAQVNHALADADVPLIEDLQPPLAVEQSDLLLILSWSFSLAALYATGIHRTRPTAVQLYAHHPNERILHRLYESATLVLTESLLGSERACHYGIDPGKILYLPYTYPAEYAYLPPSRFYVEKLAASQHKPLRKTTRVIGCVSRLEYGKNCEWAVEATRLLVAQGYDVVLVLKGDFPECSPYPDFKPFFSNMLNTYRHESWLLWDRQSSPYPQVLEEYASFDLLINPSGAEAASHVVVECLSLLKPVVLLDCSTNPYLFNGLATFVKIAPGIKQAQLPFHVPDMDSLCQALVQTLIPPAPEKVWERFDESHLQARIPLLFEPDPYILRMLYQEDRKRWLK
jgi:glycosyltransferase involved in cell wall biosynthesis